MQSDAEKIVEHAITQIADDITDCICNLVRTICFDDKALYRNILTMVELKLEIDDAE